MFDEPTFNRLHGEHNTAAPADQRDGAASDGLTHAERLLLEAFQSYELPCRARVEGDIPPAEIGLGE